ncbi:MAG: sulfatase [Pirellulales bacterium]
MKPLLLTAILCFACTFADESRLAIGAAPQRLNVVVILVDDLGWADLSCYRGDLHQTPNIDAFCRDNMKFTDAYAAAPVCSPTRASIMTGMHPARLHMTIWHEAAANPPRNRALVPPVTEGNLAHKYMTLAEMLHDADYYTAHVGKWHLGTAGYYPELQGFDMNMGGTFWGCPSTFFYPYRGPFGSRKELRYVPRMEGGKEGEYLTDRLTDEALKIMASSGDRPFFLNMCYYTVHTPIEGKPDLVAKYERLLRQGMHHTNAHYAAMVESLDQNVGRILAELKRLGIDDRTLVILTSDNGGFLKWKGKTVTDNHPLRSGKGSLYEGGIRVPLIVRWPGVTQRGSVSGEPVTTCDFYPTIREVLRLPDAKTHNPHCDGQSLVALLKNPAAHLDRESLFWHYPHYYPTTEPVSGIRAGDWKLLEYHRDRRLELFHLANDLGETTNLAGKQPNKAAQLQARLAAWRRQVNAQMPTINPDF